MSFCCFCCYCRPPFCLLKTHFFRFRSIYTIIKMVYSTTWYIYAPHRNIVLNRRPKLLFFLCLFHAFAVAFSISLSLCYSLLLYASVAESYRAKWDSHHHQFHLFDILLVLAILLSRSRIKCFAKGLRHRVLEEITWTMGKG